VVVGGNQPIRVQSMITCDTMDTEACIGQTMELAAAGCEIVRITAPTVKDAQNLRYIKEGLLERDCDVPIVADIHFKPDAAMEAALWVDKVRINPGNYADSKNSPSRSTTTTSILPNWIGYVNVLLPWSAFQRRAGSASGLGRTTAR
jgi:(E)-4-hydroxy-3-methylbut-2-enyl-diphosphate synthase